jgi:hypothetical protein
MASAAETYSLDLVGSIKPAAPNNIVGPFGLAVDGDYAYVASWYSKSFDVIDVSVPTAPTVVGRTVNNIFASAFEMALSPSGDYAYVGMTQASSNAGTGIAVVNISNPTSPILGTQINTVGGNPFNVGRMTVVGNRLYVVGNTISVFDISNEATPVALNWFEGNSNSFYGVAMNPDTQYLYVSDFNQNQIRKYLNGVYMGMITDVNLTGIASMQHYRDATGSYLIAASYVKKTLFFIDESTDAIITTLDASDSDAMDGPYSVSIDTAHKIAYVISMNEGSVAAIDISDIHNPVVLATYDSSLDSNDSGYTVVFNGGLVYGTFGNSETLQILDLNSTNNNAGTAHVSSGSVSRRAITNVARIARRRLEQPILCPAFTQQLKVGVESEDVSRLKILLSVVADYKGDISPIFDIATDAALHVFQANKHLNLVDGIYGIETHTAMSQVCLELNATRESVTQ